MPMTHPTQLKRGLSLWLLVFYGLGNILGAGIYVLVGKVAGSAGLFAPVAFLVASLVAGFTALSYAELVARYPLSAGEAVYVQKGLGLPALSVIVGLLIVLMGAVSAATIARGFVGYLAATRNLDEHNLRKAIVFGTVMASFTVEKFSLDRLREIDYEEIENRYKRIKLLTDFADIE